MLLSGSIPSLVNGVSQQPPSIRLPSQLDSQVNGYSSITDGLIKRPPTEHIKKLFEGFASANTLVHFISRDSGEQYVALFNAAFGIKVFNLLNGTEYQVRQLDGSVIDPNTDYFYLDCNDKSKDLRAVSVADSTFVANRTYKVQQSSDSNPSSTFRAFVLIKQGQYSTTYTVKVNGVTASYTTQRSGGTYDVDPATQSNNASTAALGLRTSAIATGLAAEIVTALGAGWTVTQYADSGVIKIHKNDNSSFSIDGMDDLGSKILSVVTDKVQRFADLPQVCDNGQIIKVAGDPTADEDDYWVKFTAADGMSSGRGLWEECPAPGTNRGFSVLSMPHKLTRLQDDGAGTITGTPNAIYFGWGEETGWKGRDCGDATSNPDPTFVGRYITDIFVFRNRLGFLSDTNVVLSRAGNFLDFYRKTNLSVLDDDPIDVSASHPRVVKLRYAVPFNDELICFGDKAQFTMKAGETLSPKTVGLTVATELDSEEDCRPVMSGNVVFFPCPNGNYGTVREYFFDSTTNQKDSRPITAHVPHYLPSKIRQLSVSTTEDVLVCRSSEHDLEVYRWIMNGTDKVMSSWSKWPLTTGSSTLVLGTTFVGSKLYLVMGRGGNFTLEVMDLSPGLVDADADFVTHLDRRVHPTAAVYDAVSNTTTLTLPYEDTEGGNLRVYHSGVNAGKQVSVNSITTGATTATVAVKGNVSTAAWVGFSYEMRFRFSPMMLREAHPLGGYSGVTSGRLQLRYMSVAYADCHSFSVEVTPVYRDTQTNTFVARQIGSGGIIGQINLATGSFRFPVNAKNDEVTVEVVNDSPFPSRFISAEWEGTYHNRARRV